MSEFLTQAAPYIIAFYAVSILLEIVLYLRKREDLDWRDIGTNIAMGLGQNLIGAAALIPILLAYNWIYEHAPFPLEHSWLSVVLAILLGDLAFYWAHRFNHEMNIGWATHVTHHSSTKYNLSVAVRQSWTIHFNFFFFLPIAFLGIPAISLLTFKTFDGIFQFWIHNEWTGKLPRPIEYIFSTPSHHRVHHASDEKYLDKNYGGVFILWDRLFGTFKEEEETPTYGLTKNLNSYNWLRIQFHVWADIFRGLWYAKSWRARWKLLFAPPAEALHYLPEHQPAEPVSAPTSATS